MRRDVFIYAVAIALSLLAHLGTFAGLGRAARHAAILERRVLEIAVVPTPPPAPPPVPKPPPPKPVDLTKTPVLTPPESPPPPSATEEPAEPAPPPRPVFGVSMRSVVGPGSGAAFSVRVGNTLMKEPEKELTPPAEVKPYAPVPLYRLTKMPRAVRQCEAPRELLSRGIEGLVRLEIDVLESGEVGEVKLVSGLDPEIDAAVIAAVKRCRFTPGEAGGTPVATRIPYTYRFYVEE